MSDLKPCPFCGGNAHVERMGSSRSSMQIQCGDCGASMETGETWIDDNSSWNQRATGQLRQENTELMGHLGNLIEEATQLAKFKNDTLRGRICSTDLDEPEWHDCQTICEAFDYLGNILQKHKGDSNVQ